MTRRINLTTFHIMTNNLEKTRAASRALAENTSKAVINYCQNRYNEYKIKNPNFDMKYSWERVPVNQEGKITFYITMPEYPFVCIAYENSSVVVLDPKLKTEKEKQHIENVLKEKGFQNVYFVKNQQNIASYWEDPKTKSFEYALYILEKFNEYSKNNTPKTFADRETFLDNFVEQLEEKGTQVRKKINQDITSTLSNISYRGADATNQSSTKSALERTHLEPIGHSSPIPTTLNSSAKLPSIPSSGDFSSSSAGFNSSNASSTSQSSSAFLNGGKAKLPSIPSRGAFTSSSAGATSSSPSFNSKSSESLASTDKSKSSILPPINQTVTGNGNGNKPSNFKFRISEVSGSNRDNPNSSQYDPFFKGAIKLQQELDKRGKTAKPTSQELPTESTMFSDLLNKRRNAIVGNEIGTRRK